jgi:lipoprotein signal peptidase
MCKTVKNYCHTFIFALALAAFASVKAQVVINEFSNSNRSSLVIHGESFDWVEIYNNGNAAENMSAYSLADESGDVWNFPEYGSSPIPFL